MAKLVTIDGYEATFEERVYHAAHDPKQDRWDDCPLCWADVTSDEQRDWLMELGQGGEGNSIHKTMGLLPKE